jgi:hypothetical protein
MPAPPAILMSGAPRWPCGPASRRSQPGTYVCTRHGRPDTSRWLPDGYCPFCCAWRGRRDTPRLQRPALSLLPRLARLRGQSPVQRAGSGMGVRLARARPCGRPQRRGSSSADRAYRRRRSSLRQGPSVPECGPLPCATEAHGASTRPTALDRGAMLAISSSSGPPGALLVESGPRLPSCGRWDARSGSSWQEGPSRRSQWVAGEQAEHAETGGRRRIDARLRPRRHANARTEEIE